MAVTSAQSYALRRAALNLGDNMGLHLYSGGSTAPLVMNTMALADKDSPLHIDPAVRPSKATESAPRASTPESVSEAQGASAVTSQPTSRPDVPRQSAGMDRLQGVTNTRTATAPRADDDAPAGDR